MDSTLIHDPGNYLKIDRMYAFVSVDDDGNEGVCAFYSAALGSLMPMVGADMERIESLRPIAKVLATTTQYTGKKIKLVVFENRKEIETI